MGVGGSSAGDIGERAPRSLLVQTLFPLQQSCLTGALSEFLALHLREGRAEVAYVFSRRLVISEPIVSIHNNAVE